MFDQDLYPGKPKILFVGSPYSSHVHGWIDLLAGGEFNVRLFACTDGCPPADWKVKTYIITNSVPEGLDAEWRESWWPEPEKWYAYYKAAEEYSARTDIVYVLRFLINWVLGRKKFADFPRKTLRKGARSTIPADKVLPEKPKSKTSSPQEWLADVIRSWKPDVIHTIGLDQGTSFYAEVRKRFNLENYGKWVIKVFGGSDLAFRIFDPQSLQDMPHIFAGATHVILDNQYYTNILIAKQVLEAEKICPLTPVPGSGGVDVDDLCSKWPGPPSSRRVIVWPKSYETIWSKALPVLFALQTVWDRIQPCEVYMLTTNPEMRQWISTLPEEMRQRIYVFEGVPRKVLLGLMLKSRVVLAPSLIDGVPNVMYEAMACGALPILSPIPTIKMVVNEENVIFAENLKQTQIEQALIKAMTDDELVDTCARRNIQLVKELADVKTIQPKVVAYYKLLI